MKIKFLGIALSLLFVCSSVIAQEIVGWRTDGTGKYIDATPPTEWSAEKNVLWKTKMPDKSNSTPVIVGDKIFVCSEPTTLVCVSANDGKILWQRENTYLDTVLPEEVDKVRRQLEEVDIDNTTKEFRKTENQLNNAKNKLEKSPDDAELKQKVEEFSKKFEELKAKLAPVDKYVIPITHDVNGYSSPTPVSDGKNVYVVFGTGVAACYDMEGNRHWIKMVEKTKHGWGHSASPLLINDKLLVHINSLVALNKKTGEKIWQSEANPRWGTSVHTRLGNVDVIITPNGDFFRVSDGKLIASNVSALEYAGPIIHFGAVYFIEFGGKSLNLPLEAADAITPEVIWETKPRKERYYASSVYHEGLIYAINQQSFFSVIDDGTGEVLYEKKLKLGKGTVYPSVTLGGNYLFVSNDNGTTIVLETGREPKEIATNTLETFRSSPVFVGKKMYIRGMEHLYCIGE